MTKPLHWIGIGEREGETEETTRTKAIGSKIKQCRSTTVTDAIALSLAKETKSSSTVGTNRAFSNRRD